MTEQTDLASITDPTVLKAMVYDRLAALEQIQGEVRMINERISQLAANPVEMNGKVMAKK